MQKNYFAAVAPQLLPDYTRLLMFNAQFSGCMQGNQRRPGRGVLGRGWSLKSNTALPSNTCLLDRVHLLESQRQIFQLLLAADRRGYRPDDHNRRCRLGAVSTAQTRF
jgi:hypothetical protein